MIWRSQRGLAVNLVNPVWMGDSTRKVQFYLSKTLDFVSGGDPGTAQRPKKGYFEKRVFSDNLARNAFFMFFLPCVFCDEKEVKKTMKKKPLHF